MDFEKLDEYRCEGKYCDITVEVQGRTFKCHRVILALSSDYFDVMFGGNFKETKVDSIVVHEIDSLSFEEILQSIYTGQEVLITKSNAYRLLLTSEFLKMFTLEGRCVDYIINNVSRIPDSDLFGILNYACAMGRTLLIDTLSQFILKYFNKCSRSQAVPEMSPDTLRTLLTQFRSPLPTFSMLPFSDENVLLDVLVRWVDYDAKERVGQFTELIELLDFERISMDYKKFLLKEYKMDYPGTEIWEDKGTFKKDLLDHFTNTSRTGAICENDLPIPYLDVQFPTLHVFVDYNYRKNCKKRWIFSINKLIPDWYLSRTIVSGADHDQSPKKAKLSVHNFDDFYLRNVTIENSDYIYCLETNLYRGGQQKFHAYSSVERSYSDKIILRRPPVFIPSFDICGLEEKIYLYDSNVHCNTGVFSKRLHPLHPMKRFNTEEIRRGIFCYFCTSDVWMPVPEMKVKVSGASMTDNKDLLYLIGGRDMQNQVSRGYVQAYDFRAPNWFEVPKTEHLFYHARSCSLNGKIYVTDGKRMEEFDPIAQKWTTINCIDVLRNCGDFMMMPFQNQLWIISGENDGRISKSRACSQILNPVVSSYDTISQEWCTSMSLNGEITRTVNDSQGYLKAYNGPYAAVKDAIVHKSLRA